MQFAPDDRIGSYQVLSPLGSGGMGEVYRGLDTRLQRTVALKVLGAACMDNPERCRRFLHEARAASALSHPNIAHIYEVGESFGVMFIAMEFIDGVTLADRIAGRSRPPQLRTWAPRWRTAWMRRTRKESFIATSSPPTSW